MASDPKKPAKTAKPKASAAPESQSEMAKKLYEKLHGAETAKGGPPGGPGGQQKGFDPKSARGGKGAMGAAHNQLMRRTQSRGGGGGGGGGGGA